MLFIRQPIFRLIYMNGRWWCLCEGVATLIRAPQGRMRANLPVGPQSLSLYIPSSSNWGAQVVEEVCWEPHST